MATGPWARFDDLRASRSLLFPSVEQVLVAEHEDALRARFSVAIRTVVAGRCTGRAVYGVGGGITWDAAPAAEHPELAARAAVLTVPQATAVSTTGRAG